MNYESYDQEWDETYEEMFKFQPELYDDVLCCNPEVHAGKVDNINIRNGIRYYMVRLSDGTVDEFAESDVLKRKIEEVAA
ncbi:MAG: hypothetical protein LBB89_06510 [Treponema sp.]|jgi:hypothetical protein|nr:hypothetical protein [Treponema sp.]